MGNSTRQRATVFSAHCGVRPYMNKPLDLQDKLSAWAPLVTT